MFNPWVILGVVLFWIASVGGAYLKGGKAAEDHARAQYATEMEATIKQNNENAVVDMQAAAKVAAAEATAKTRAAMLRGKVDVVIAKTPSSLSCAWPVERFGLLLVAVQEANGDQTAFADGLSTAVSRANASSKSK